MKYEAKIQDPTISQKVTERLSSLGVRAPCRVMVMSNKGNVTLSGTIQYEHQRHMALREQECPGSAARRGPNAGNPKWSALEDQSHARR